MTSAQIDPLIFPRVGQIEFAMLSGDWNPIHIDDSAARRTALGRTVVHGMHTLLQALEGLAKSFPHLSLPSTMKVRFLRPVYVDESLALTYVPSKDNELRLQALVEGVTATDVHITLDDYPSTRDSLGSYVMDDRVTCRDLSLAEMGGCSGTILPAASPEAICARFPHTVRWLGIDRVSGLLCMSRLVGMECPGLHSLFSGFTIECRQPHTPPALEYKVVCIEERFRLLKMNINGLRIRGSVEAFVRYPPITQMRVKELSAFVTPGEFAGQRCLVVGGSRGLGELTAKLLSAGGGHPTITYAVGKEDAEQIVADISQWGGHCELFKYDVRAPVEQQLALMADPVSHFYYFATCPIARRRTRPFDSAALQEFLDFYVHGFYDLCVALRGKHRHGIVAFYPSSVFVEDRPRGMAEYAMAKSAGEVLCEYLNRFVSGINIVSVRLPRLLTDQTATFVLPQTANSVDVILPIVRRVQSTRL